jgi:hypothetical protein
VCPSIRLYHLKYWNGFRCNLVFWGVCTKSCRSSFMLAPYRSNTTPKIYENQIKLNFLKSDPSYKNLHTTCRPTIGFIQFCSTVLKMISDNVNIHTLSHTVYMGAEIAQLVKRLAYGLDGRGVRFRIPVGVRFFCFLHRPNRVLGSTRAPTQCVSGALSPAGTWSWPLTSNQYRGQDCIHSPVRLHGVVLN